MLGNRFLVSLVEFSLLFSISDGSKFSMIEKIMKEILRPNDKGRKEPKKLLNTNLLIVQLDLVPIYSGGR